jgi:outer membrane protein OmpA-like peptidoglycan-associated protein
MVSAHRHHFPPFPEENPVNRSFVLVALIALSACAGPQAVAPVAAQLPRCSPREELRPLPVVDGRGAIVRSTNGAPVTHGTAQKVTVAPPPDCKQLVASAAPAPKPAAPAEPAAAAVFDPPAGEYARAQSVALSSTTPGAVIHYTADGSVPTADSPAYTNPIPVEKSTTLRAIVVAPGAPNSATSTGAYTIAPPPPSRVTVAKSRLELKEVVLFETGKATIDQRSHSLLDEVAAALKDHSEVKNVRIEGHTDDTGAAAANMTLSQSRAEQVREYLTGQGVAVDRLAAKGYGESRPVESNKTTEGRTANRRVDFIIAE